MENPNSHKRANWKREFVVDRANSPLFRLAVTARDKMTPAERAALVTKNAFNSALDELLKRDDLMNDMEDLTGNERAFCEGWATLARLKCTNANGDLDDQMLKNWIHEQINTPSIYEVLTG
jgi:hypothetical protein